MRARGREPTGPSSHARRRADWRADVWGALMCAMGVLAWAALFYLVIP